MYDRLHHVKQYKLAGIRTSEVFYLSRKDIQQRGDAVEDIKIGLSKRTGVFRKMYNIMEKI